MVAGRPLDKTILNNAWGVLATDLFSVMHRIQEAKDVLDGYSSSDLQTLFGYEANDADRLKSAATFMGDLASIFNNGPSAYLTGTHDYRVFTKNLLGPGTY